MLLQSSVFSLIPNDWPNCLVTHQPRLKMNHIETERLCAFKWLVPSLPEVAGADVSASLCQHSKPMRFHQWLLGPSWRSITTHGCLLFWWLTFRSTLWLGFLSRPYTCKNKPQPRVYVGYTILKFQDFLFRHIHRSLILEWFQCRKCLNGTVNSLPNSLINVRPNLGNTCPWHNEKLPRELGWWWLHHQTQQTIRTLKCGNHTNFSA